MYAADQAFEEAAGQGLLPPPLPRGGPNERPFQPYGYAQDSRVAMTQRALSCRNVVEGQLPPPPPVWDRAASLGDALDAPLACLFPPPEDGVINPATAPYLLSRAPALSLPTSAATPPTHSVPPREAGTRGREKVVATRDVSYDSDEDARMQQRTQQIQERGHRALVQTGRTPSPPDPMAGAGDYVLPSPPSAKRQRHR